MHFSRLLHAPVLALTAIVALGSNSPSRAAVVTAFDLSAVGGATLVEFVAPTTIASGVTASNLTRTANLTGNPAFGTFGAYNWPTGAFTGAKYFSFTISPGVGATATLSRLSFGEKRRATQGPMNFEVRTSLDNYGAPLAADTVTLYDDVTFSSTRQQTYSLGAAFANLSAPVTFRFYAYNATTAGAFGLWQISNYDGSAGGASGGLIVEGTVSQTVSAVPESPALLLTTSALAAALVGMRITRRPPPAA